MIHIFAIIWALGCYIFMHSHVTHWFIWWRTHAHRLHVNTTTQCMLHVHRPTHRHTHDHTYTLAQAHTHTRTHTLSLTHIIVGSPSGWRVHGHGGAVRVWQSRQRPLLWGWETLSDYEVEKVIVVQIVEVEIGWVDVAETWSNYYILSVQGILLWLFKRVSGANQNTECI